MSFTESKKMALLSLLLLALLVFDNVSAAENKIYTVDLEFVKGDILFKNVSVSIGFAPDRKIQPETGYKAEVLSFSGTRLYSFKFEVPNVLWPVPPLEGMPPQGPIILEKLNFALIIPYFENGKTIDIYDQTGVKKLSIDVSQFSSGYKISKIPSSQMIERAILIVLVGGIAIMIGMILFTLYKKRGGR